MRTQQPGKGGRSRCVKKKKSLKKNQWKNTCEDQCLKTQALTFNQKFLECSLSPTYYHSSITTTVKYWGILAERASRKRLVKGKYLGKYKVEKGDKNEDTREI